MDRALLDLTLPTPEENLALDEALLERCERDGTEALRFWEAQEYFVVLGRAQRRRSDVAVAFLGDGTHGTLPVLRRISGGGTVLQGPGCLSYAVILRLDSTPRLADVAGSNAFFLERNRRALGGVVAASLSFDGVSDLAIDGRKFSGNAQRRGRLAVLFHGTLLYDFDLELVEKTLNLPEKQPSYRAQRTHVDFLTNLDADPESLKAALARGWNARVTLAEIPIEAVQRLVEERYSKDEWNNRF